MAVNYTLRQWPRASTANAVWPLCISNPVLYSFLSEVNLHHHPVMASATCINSLVKVWNWNELDHFPVDPVVQKAGDKNPKSFFFS
mgnify:CR=1 FL=1